jgi:hypothetical protein
MFGQTNMKTNRAKGEKWKGESIARLMGFVCVRARACFQGVMKEFQKQKDFWLCSFKCKISDEKS